MIYKNPPSKIVCSVSGNSPYHAAQNLAQGERFYREGAGDRVYRFTIEDITPAPEHPQWWDWDGESWYEASVDSVSVGTNLFDRFMVSIYGTTANRDTKRDALLEAARKAGKP